jgi:Xaa-Pro aminopeptidase
VNEPDFVLMMDGKDYLIAPKRSDYLRIFSGGLDCEKIKQSSGVAEVLEHEAGWKRLGAKLKKAKAAATVQPLPSYIGQMGFYTNPADKNLMEKMAAYNAGLKLIDLRTHLARLRAVKTAGELRCIRRATNESAKLHELVAANLKQFKTERDAGDFIKTQAIEKGLELAYEPIAAAGKNAAILHYENGRDKLEPSLPLLVDAAFSYLGYCSDITRTYCARPNKRYPQIHAAVVEVQKHAIGLLKPGAKLEDCEKSVRKIMGHTLKRLGLAKKPDEKSTARYYPHRTSHFLGLDAHDPGDPDQPLAPGMVLSVEPGIYVPEESIGVRIEDVALITESGCEVLSAKLPKDNGVG